jgi:heme A synthase
MANIAVGFGIALIVLGFGGYVGSGMVSMTALIPAAFGILLLALGVMASNPARRKLAMHIAVVVALLGFLGSARGLMGLGSLLTGEAVPRPMAVIGQAIMALLCLAFTALCVRSFINARKNRSVEGM